MVEAAGEDDRAGDDRDGEERAHDRRPRRHRSAAASGLQCHTDTRGHRGRRAGRRERMGDAMRQRAAAVASLCSRRRAPPRRPGREHEHRGHDDQRPEHESRRVDPEPGVGLHVARDPDRCQR